MKNSSIILKLLENFQNRGNCLSHHILLHADSIEPSGAVQELIFCSLCWGQSFKLSEEKLAVVPIQLFEALSQQTNTVSILSLAICCPKPPPTKLKLSTSREIQPLWGLGEFCHWHHCTRTSVWRTSMNLREALSGFIFGFIFLSAPGTTNHIIVYSALSPQMLWSTCFVRTGQRNTSAERSVWCRVRWSDLVVPGTEGWEQGVQWHPK